MSVSCLLSDVTPFREGLCTAQHYSIFPLALGQILREYAITELHMTLNAGNWDHERWGTPQEPGAATGGELWAWMGVSEHMS